MTQDMTKDTTLHTIAKRMMLLLLMMTLGVGATWGDPTAITSATDLNAMTASGDYVITADIEIPTDGYTTKTSFSGTLEAAINPETKMPYRIKKLSAPLFTTLTGTVKNLVLEDVGISSHSGNTGAIACEATGDARIYNVGILSGSVGGTGYTGGLVGLLNNTETGGARVINCYSFANITGGSVKAGIVGYNNYASRHADIKTMVMNCMFYGDIATGDIVAPIYGGLEISNEDKVDNVERRLNNYNYYLYEAPFSKNNTKTNILITNYNRALAAEERYLNRFEFYRYLLNSTRELAAFYVDPSPETIKISNKDHKRYHVDLMAKWVLDKSIAPYPILKEQGKYPSVVNYDPVYTNDETGAKVLRTSISNTEENRNKGGWIGTLTVHIGGVGDNAPEGASILRRGAIQLPRTDKDYNNFNFNYDKVQLPYYNDVGTKNYTSNKVVTGWKITSMSKSAGSFSNNTYDVPSYNFADRECTQKDIYGVSGRVFSQGAYFDVPDGVSSITIEPYWGNAAYLSDANYDCYGYGGNGVGSFGLRYNNGSNYTINDDSQPVYTSISNALSRLDALGRSTSTSVYDNAVVLVGNYHKGGTGAPSKDDKPYTIMSADLNMDNEPDNSYISYSGKNQEISPIRFDFVNAPGMAMAHKLTSETTMGIIGNMKPHGWFEVTNTCVIRFSQLEYDWESKKNDTPLILLGGIIEQIVSNNTNGKDLNDAKFTDNTNYIHVGSNVWFKMFSNGAHMDHPTPTPHRPISVTGGEYEKFYLSGFFRPDAYTIATTDNAECYISGGKFGEVAGAGQENINGSVTWQINYADINSFFGGGLKDATGNYQIAGDINISIKNSHVGLFCGGPKFGNMADGKTVETTATGCTFDNYFGAGYGGTALVRVNTFNKFNTLSYNWNGTSEDVKMTPKFTESNGANKRGQYVANQGIAVNYEYENFEGSSNKTVGRLYVNYASLSLAKTNGATSSLTGCTIKENFYGGGSLGKVEGDITSTLTNCTVHGSVFGAGFSATIPTAEVFPAQGFNPEPYYNDKTGVFEKGGYPTAVKYTWSNSKGGNSDAKSLVDDAEGHWIHTDVSLLDLGTVTGDVTLNIEGNTVVMGKIVNKDEDGNFTSYGAQTGGVFGGGDSSSVTGDTEVKINASSQKTTEGYDYNSYNVFGGGNKASVTGDSKVTLKNKSVISNNVFGGGNEAVVTGSAEVNIE